MKTPRVKLMVTAACAATVLSGTCAFAGEGGASMTNTAPYGVTTAGESPGDLRRGFHFDIGIAYAQGAYDVMDRLKENFALNDSFVWPVGLIFSPYYEFDNGLGAGLDFGPSSYFEVQQFVGTSYNYIFPVGADVRYTLLRDRTIAPYLKGGIRYAITSGSYLRSGDPGAYGGVGLEFFRDKHAGFAVEVGYDSSTVHVIGGPLGGEKRVTYGGFMASLIVNF